MAIEVEGFDELNRRLAEISEKSPEAAEAGAYAGGLVVQRASQEETPVEYGNLRASAYTHKIPGGAEVGYTSEYALFVHENMEQKLAGEPRESGLGTYWNPGGPKFLERAVNEHEQDVIDQIEAQLARILE